MLTSVKVVGVGGGGGKAVARMTKHFTRGVDFVAINTDHQDLDQCDVKHRLYIGRTLTKGLGTGMNPDLGRQAAEENRSEIAEALKGADLIFISAGLGGGTGSGASPVVAEVAKQTGALTVAVVTKPFAFEGAQRERIAKESLMKLKDKVDAIIVVPNDRIFTVISKDTPILKAFEAIDEVLRNALRGLVDLIITPGIINVDFADVRSIIQDSGMSIIGIGIATGPERAVNAINLALHSPLLEMSADGAKAVLLGISGGKDLRMTEINDAAKVVSQMVDPGARIIFGAYYDKALKPNQVKVTVIATGFNGNQPNSLFGGGSMTEKRPSYLDAAPAAHHTPQGSFGEKNRPIFEHGKKPAAPVSHHGKMDDDEDDVKKEERSFDNAEPKKETDPWEIPAFLRRRKK